MRAAVRPDQRGPAARWSLRRFAAVLLNWLKKDLFRRTEGGPVGWRKILLAVACVIAGTAISLSRTVGAGSLNTIWIEDAKFLLNQALNMSVLARPDGPDQQLLPGTRPHLHRDRDPVPARPGHPA